jgi:hypothetical protein
MFYAAPGRRGRDNAAMPILSIASLAVAAGTALVIWLMARQFSRRYVELNGRVPPPSWMFRSQQDPVLEFPRKRALSLLPILIVAAIVYVVNS